MLEHQWLETDELLDVSFTCVVSSFVSCVSVAFRQRLISKRRKSFCNVGLGCRVCMFPLALELTASLKSAILFGRVLSAFQSVFVFLRSLVSLSSAHGFV